MIFFLYKLIKLPQLLNQTKILIRLNILGNQISFSFNGFLGKTKE